MDNEELHISRMQKVDFKHIYKENIEIITAMNVSKRKRNPVRSEMSMRFSVRMDNTDSVLSTNKKILCFNNSRYFLSRFLQAILSRQTSDFSKSSKGFRGHTLSDASIFHQCWILTCPYVPMTLEGSGTFFSQLSNATAGEVMHPQRPLPVWWVQN